MPSTGFSSLLLISYQRLRAYLDGKSWLTDCACILRLRGFGRLRAASQAPLWTRVRQKKIFPYWYRNPSRVLSCSTPVLGARSYAVASPELQQFVVGRYHTHLLSTDDVFRKWLAVAQIITQ